MASKQKSVPEQFRRLRDELRGCSSHPWERIAVWIEKALPFFTAHFPAYAEDFRRVTKQPQPCALPKVITLDRATDDAQSRRIRSIEQATDRKNFENAKQKIMSFLDGMVNVAEHIGIGTQPPPEKKPKMPEAPTTPSVTRVFISHSSKDQKIVDALADLLQLTCELPPKAIFCTSIEGMGIPNGMNFIDVIKKNLVGSAVVIFVLSRSYFDSMFCLTELGATWALSTRPLFLLVPPIDYGDMNGVLSNLQAAKIDDSTRLTQFWEELLGLLQLGTKSSSRWELKRDEFLGKIEPLLGLQPEPSAIPYETYKALADKFEDCKTELAASYEDTKRLNEQIEALKNAKDRTEVAAIEKQYTETDENQEYCDLLVAVRESVRKLSPTVREVMYRHFKKERVDSSDLDYEQLQHELDNKFLLQELGRVKLNESDRKVKEALAAVKKFGQFLERASPAYLDTLETALGFQAELDNKRLWEEVFCRYR